MKRPMAGRLCVGGALVALFMWTQVALPTAPAQPLPNPTLIAPSP